MNDVSSRTETSMFLKTLAMTLTDASLVCSWTIHAPTASTVWFFALGSRVFSTFQPKFFGNGH